MGINPIGDNKNLIILVAIDHYTKGMETRIIEEKPATQICKAVEELIVWKHDLPAIILTDQDRNPKTSIRLA